MNKLILLLLIFPVFLFSQEFEQSNLYHYDVICEDYRVLYAENPDVYQKSIDLYGGLRNIHLDENYIYMSFSQGVCRIAMDGSRMDSLFYRPIDYDDPDYLSPLHIHGDIFFIQDYRDSKCYMSKDRGGNWEIIADFGEESDLRVNTMIDENTFFMNIYSPVHLGAPSKSHLLLITKDKFKTIDTTDKLERSDSNFLKESGFGGGIELGESQDEIFSFFHEKIYDETVTDSLIGFQYYCIKTEDGGQSWNRYPINVKYETSITDFYQFGDTLFCGGSRKRNPESNNSFRYGNIIRSTDRGKNWKNIIAVDTFPAIRNFKAWNTDNMFFEAYEKDYMVWTTNGGKTWKYNEDEEINSTNGSSGIRDVVYQNENTALIFIGYKIYKVMLNAPTSVKETTLQKGMVYPNPAKQSLNIDLGIVPINSNFSISDIQGQKMQSGIFAGGDIDISGLPPGVYQITIESSETNYTEIFVKE